MKTQLLTLIANADQTGRKLVRLAIVIVFLWIGGLKFFTYEADGIVPFIANSPFMSFLYQDPAGYRQHVNKEGELIPANHQWHAANRTYVVSNGLGIFLVTVALLVALHPVAPLASVVGSILIFIMTLGTLSFLITTPESWVPNLGDTDWGFPYLSGRGRLVIKDAVILAGTLITMSDSARLFLERRAYNS
nr:DUF417 family protein [uncultured Dyadobacter sp.]